MASAETVAKIGATGYETLAAAVSAAQAGETVEITVAGDYTLPNIPTNITIKGGVDGVVFNHTAGGNIASIPNGATFENVTFNFGNVDYHGFQHAGTINMKGCTLNGRLCSYGNMNFTNCQFVQDNSDYHMWCYDGDVTYANCTFTNNKTGKFLNVYNEGNGAHKVTVTGCQFINNSVNTSKAAINVKATCVKDGKTLILEYTVDVENSTAEGPFPEPGVKDNSDHTDVISALVQVDDRTVAASSEKITVNVDNEPVYQKGAEVEVVEINTVADLKTFRDAVNSGNQYSGKIVRLMADLDLSSETNWKPIGNLVSYPGQSFDGICFDGNNHTISNVTINDNTPNHAVAALFGSVVNATIKNLTVKNVNITSTHYAAGIVAYTSNKPTIDNCHVIGGTITSTPELVGSEYDNGDKVGGIMGYATAGSTITNCTVEGLTLTAYRDLAGICGYAAGAVTDCTVKDVTVVQDNTNAYLTEDVAYTACEVVGGRSANAAATNSGNGNTTENVIITHPVSGVAQIGTTTYATLKEALDAAEAAGTKNIVIDLLADAELEINAWSGVNNKSAIGTAETESITINGNGHKLTFMTLNTDWNNVATMNDAVTKLTLNDMTIDQGGKNTKGTWNAYDINFNCAVELNNVTSNRPLAFKNGATLKDVTINVDNNKDVYGIWIQPNGQDVNIDGLTVTASRGIKIDEQYVTAPDHTNLDIANATFNTTGTKPAILVKTAGGATITAGKDINIENVAADKTNLVWIDKAKSAEFYNVTVTGANIVPEGGEVAYVASLVRGEQVRGYYKTFAEAYNSTDYEEGDSYVLHENTTETVEVSKALTIVKNGFTAANLTAAEGFQKTETDENITFVAFNPVAQIGDTKYETLEAAFAAAQDGETITLLADCAGNGIKVPQGKYTTGLTVNFGGFTYTVDGATVGSTGTETQAFQLLKDNKITFQNGTIYSEKAKILVQNYSNLTLEGMTLTLNNTSYNGAYTLSNNNGEVVIDNTTINANPAGAFAFDVCRFSSYPSVGVTVTGESKINGNVEISASKGQAKDGLSLNLKGGTMTGDIVVDATAATIIEKTPEKAVVTKADAFEKTAPEGFKWESNGDGTSTLVEDIIVLTDGIAYTNDEDITNAKVAYKRTFGADRANVFQAWMVPFDYTLTATDVANFDFYEINTIEYAEQDNTTKMKIRLSSAKAAGNELEANMPYIYMPKSAVGEYTFKAESVTLTAADGATVRKNFGVASGVSVDFYSVYQNTKPTDENFIYYMSKAGKVGYSRLSTSGFAGVGPFRWIFKVSGTNAPSTAFTFGFAADEDDDVTAVSSAAAEAEGEVVGYYTLNGQKVSEPTKGVYVVKYANGTSKKVVF